ncbi:SH3-containing GRB2-like protein 3-interacting protein 1 isoform X3 [Silurus asotus]|uniref:SH3-containing GRB2-like protein 3-interacting protein 1 isoform X3 n=1 Tax=Silurus asotus TaxID=30991 RepID=A0AAD5FED3_SILAS|nr:SH3-containing GRB2-like protein 3-interacting protein 1 isoform X3 [Silurus asotus]
MLSERLEERRKRRRGGRGGEEEEEKKDGTEIVLGVEHVSEFQSISLFLVICTGEEIARPRRSTPTPTLTPGPGPDTPSKRLSDNASAFFGPPFEANFEAQNSEVFIAEPELWCPSTPRNTSPLNRRFPTGAPPPLPPKNIPATPPSYRSSSLESSGYYSVVPTVRGEGSSSIYRDVLLSDPTGGPAVPDMDNVFAPSDTPKSDSEILQSNWISFSAGTTSRPPPPNEPAPSPPLLSSSEDTPPTSPPASSPPPLHPIPPPESPPPPPPDSSPDSLSPDGLPPQQHSTFHLQESGFFMTTPPTLPSPGMPFLPTVPPPLGPREDSRRTPDSFGLREEILLLSTSPKDIGLAGLRGTPPPLPPLTYRSVVVSPGPGSRPSSPARPGTPLSAGSPIPPLPPRPSSRPKLPPGKPNVSDLAWPLSAPVHSWSPPPFAPLARAESSSSISSITSHSAASTPTLAREFNLSVSACSRGPSPLTMGPQDTLPVAAAFTETISAYFKGADPSNDTMPAISDCKEFRVNMHNLMAHLKKVSDQRPQATYYNVDMLKYQVSARGIQSTPLNLAVSWRGDAYSTDLRIDYKYNAEAMTSPTPLTNIQFLVPVDGGVSKLQAMLPPATWNPETQKILWKISELSQKSENGGVGALLCRFQLAEGPSKPSQLAVQFTSEGSTLSGCDFHLLGSGYRLSLVKKRFSTGKYLADN